MIIKHVAGNWRRYSFLCLNYSGSTVWRADSNKFFCGGYQIWFAPLFRCLFILFHKVEVYFLFYLECFMGVTVLLPIKIGIFWQVRCFSASVKFKGLDFWAELERRFQQIVGIRSVAPVGKTRKTDHLRTSKPSPVICQTLVACISTSKPDPKWFSVTNPDFWTLSIQIITELSQLTIGVTCCGRVT